ncbi:MAG: TIGR02452 family protein [Oscillospiraceae bacterium]
MNNDTEKRIEIFEDTMRLCKENAKLAEAIKTSKANTKFYAADDCPKKANLNTERSTEINVTSERTLEAAKRLSEKYGGKRIAVLNFASATNPGGGVTKGSSAQEEALCRCSTLYPCLKTNELYGQFYSMHKERHDVRYTDACIYTPGIISIKSDTAFPQAVSESEWFSVDVITCAAPNLREKPYNFMNPGQGKAIKVSPAELLEIHKKRGAHILDIAAANGADVVVLGAFGCGAFRNDPIIVARAYKEILPSYKNVFDEIVFAVYCSPKDTGNFDTFKRILTNVY